jgi:hypothetical protein
MNDSYANYFCLKFFGLLEKNERIKFLNSIKPFGKKIATNNVGTYPLQGIIESIKLRDEAIIVVETYKPHIIELSYVSKLNYPRILMEPI